LIKSQLLYQLSYTPKIFVASLPVVGRAGFEPATNGLKVRTTSRILRIKGNIPSGINAFGGFFRKPLLSIPSQTSTDFSRSRCGFGTHQRHTSMPAKSGVPCLMHRQTPDKKYTISGGLGLGRKGQSFFASPHLARVSEGTNTANTRHAKSIYRLLAIKK
jgi:hypothetical protein